MGNFRRENTTKFKEFDMSQFRDKSGNPKKTGNFKKKFDRGSDKRGSSGAPRARFDSKSRFSDRKPDVLVTCDKCGKECSVPFKPTGDKPVYCSQCFKKSDRNEPRGGRRSSAQGVRFEHSTRPERNDRFQRSARSEQRSNIDLEQINQKLDKIMDALGID